MTTLNQTYYDPHSPLQQLKADSSFPIWESMIRMQQEWEFPIRLSSQVAKSDDQVVALQNSDLSSRL